MTLIELVQNNLGKPWRVGTNGPDAFDCWGWAQFVQHNGFHRYIETISEPPANPRELIEFVKNHAARKSWREVSKPVHGGLVELAHNTRPFHIGVYLDIDGGGITHAAPRIGVTFDTVLALRAAGWRRFTFHEYIGDQG